MNTANITM